jgi:phosphonate transport system substrate-binding protein
MMRAFLRCAAAAMALGASSLGAAAQTPSEINFGVISTEASMNQKKNWEPFLQEMSKATGFKVNGFYATDYAGVIEAMRFNKIQIAWYGNKSGMEAVDRASGEVFARVVARDGSVGYYSHIIVHKDSPFAKVEDILKCDKSLDFGIGDPNSTSGFLVPTAYIFAARNIDPKTCFRTLRNANHQANAMAVAAGRGRDQQQRGPAARGGRGAGRAQPDQDHLDLAAHPARSAGVAQGPRSGRQDEALHLPDELRPHRLG